MLDKWKREIAKKAKDNFHLAKQAVEEGQDQIITETAMKIINWLEELFEEKSKNSGLKSRLEHFEQYFRTPQLLSNAHPPIPSKAQLYRIPKPQLCHPARPSTRAHAEHPL
ncbi:MAG: hypothetical protein QY332_10045 [Anaerolineales bacterium]|nr:MAG: hypothetical protein QY332_10045 [Anaerolineales bacterium]